MSPADFLRAECSNVKSTLDETLRHDYGLENRHEYYVECSIRLKVLQARLEKVSEADQPALAGIASSLSELSRIISRIERSHLGEFSWPFADELKKIVDPLCQEDPSDLDTRPILHILSDGGLSAYAFHPEAGRRAVSARRRIINIVFPRTLKHYVLYHSLLGHEVGHAVRRIERHDSYLRKTVLKALRARGPLQDTDSATAWMTKTKAPPEVAIVRRLYQSKYRHWLEMNSARLDGWHEEFMCDLFGLMIVGPAYLLAQATMLTALSPYMTAWGDRHPPYACRVYLLSKAWKVLGWQAPRLASSRMNRAARDMLKHAMSELHNHPWVRLFDDAQIASAVRAVRSLLESCSPSLYSPPDSKLLGRLVDMLAQRLPPCGAVLGRKGVPANQEVDFRHILYAGWLFWWAANTKRFPSPLDFLQVNRLCEQGMVQQQAINLVLHHPSRSKKYERTIET